MKMRKMLALLLALMMILSACGSDGKGSASEAEGSSLHQQAEAAGGEEIRMTVEAFEAEYRSVNSAYEMEIKLRNPTNQVITQMELMLDLLDNTGDIQQSIWTGSESRVEGGQAITMKAVLPGEEIPGNIRIVTGAAAFEDGTFARIVMEPGFTIKCDESGERISYAQRFNTPQHADSATGHNLIAAGDYFSIFVNANGTVTANGRNDMKQCEVSHWEDIIDVAAHSHTVALKADGRVVATGNNNVGQCDVHGWMDIVDIDANHVNSIGLTADGKVVICGSKWDGWDEVYNWTDIAGVAVGGKTAYGLKTNGRVIGTGSDSAGQMNVSGWQDIVAISAGMDHVVGLRSDGTVVAAGSNSFGQCEVTSWKNIVAICTGNTTTIGLRSDGVVIAAGSNEKEQCNVGEWKDVVAISTGLYHTIGVTADGQRLSTGDNAYGQRDVNK